MLIKLPKQAQLVIATLQKAGFEAYAVGGSVRDLLLGRPTHGWDFATNAIPQKILEIFPDSFYDNQFGTVGIKVYKLSPFPSTPNPEIEDIYEITTYRSERGYADHRHPDKIIWGKTINEDLARRDFTINAIAFDGKNLIDPYHGQTDLGTKLIRAVGDPRQRFNEDALRLLRAVRLATQLGFLIEENTFAALREKATDLDKISAERIQKELWLILASEYASDGILLLRSSGLLSVILPELDQAFITPQKSPGRHHLYDVGTHSVLALKFCPVKDPLVRLATLIHDIGKPLTFRQDNNGLITFYNHEVVGTKITREIAKRLRFSRHDTKKLLTLIRWHQFSVDERQTDAALRRLIRRIGKENLNDMLALRLGDRLGGGARETSWRLELFKKRMEEVQKQPFTIADLAINGHDVMKEFNCQPGPLVGKALISLFIEVEAKILANEHAALLSRLREIKNSLIEQN